MWLFSTSWSKLPEQVISQALRNNPCVEYKLANCVSRHHFNLHHTSIPIDLFGLPTILHLSMDNFPLI